MSRKYRELVAIQVTFSKVTAKYRLTHHYRIVTPMEHSGVMTLVGYDMDRHESVQGITESLRNAYAPAVLSIWTRDEQASNSEVLQLHPGSRPDELGLPGNWSLWAQL